MGGWGVQGEDEAVGLGWVGADADGGCRRRCCCWIPDDDDDESRRPWSRPSSSSWASRDET